MEQLEKTEERLPFEKLPKETTKAFAAFKAYLDMGPQRSLRRTCEVMGCKKGRIEWLSRKYDWPARVAARDVHVAELERLAIERLAVEKAVEWWQMHEPARRQAWLEAEEAITMVREARERWRKSGRTPTFEGMARMLDLAFKLKQFAAGMPSEIKETHTLVSGKVSVEWEEAIRKAYAEVDAPAAPVVDVQEVKP